MLSAREAASATDKQTLELVEFNPEVPSTHLDAALAGERSREVLAVQVLLDRSRHSPGVIDGFMGGNTLRAIRYYREAHGLPAEGGIDQELLQSLAESQTGKVLERYTITPEDVEGPFYRVPDSMAEMAELERVGWEAPQELLADKFHMDQSLLQALNPGIDFSRAGARITVVAHGKETLPSDIARIEIRKSDNSVVAFDAQGTIMASYPATVGSGQFPSPSGTMEVTAIAPDANYTFDPSGREWGPDQELIIPPGANNPVGGIWIDLSKAGYGIHGSPDPQLIGKTASHGCVRLTNWDAKELAGSVNPGTTVSFTERTASGT